MFNKLKKDDGFTMIEMMIVLLIITLLLLIAVPNMTKNNNMAQSKSCDATVKLLESQAGAYEIETGDTLSSLEELADAGYVDRVTCADGEKLNYQNGKVVRVSE
ncbi:competence type IV pilus major pilin ComGC [Alteribacillus sp. HJP-4]|uniref:competence type IV pilus major pilin ComGC n=1 Tax=Alteribacillus sp. HJP-4 TaxID=2775394 RepID=UPI0035CD33EC